LSTAAKVAWFEELVALVVRFGVRDRLSERRDPSLDEGLV
jgi:hypothetical protein